MAVRVRNKFKTFARTDPETAHFHRLFHPRENGNSPATRILKTSDGAIFKHIKCSVTGVQNFSVPLKERFGDVPLFASEYLYRQILGPGWGHKIFIYISRSSPVQCPSLPNNAGRIIF